MTLSPVVYMWIPAYLIIGAAAWALDLRWGVPLRRFLVNLALPEPRDVTEGFLVGRPRRTRLGWAAVITAALSAVLIATGSVSWVVQVPLALGEALACLVGMELGPATVLALSAIGVSLDRADRIQQVVRTEAPRLVERAVAAGEEAAAGLAERVTPAPGPSEEDVRQAKIDRMDELLGRPKPEPEREPEREPAREPEPPPGKGPPGE
jgi:hypothetical protein